jgi:iron(II)-dependent oxidoreductase
LWTVVAVSAVCVTAGIVTGRTVPVGLGAVGLAYCLLRLAAAQRSSRQNTEDRVPPAVCSTDGPYQDARDPDHADALVGQMLAQGRYALLLRPQIAGNLDDEQFHQAIEALETEMALVPDGEVVLGPIDDALDDGKLDEKEIAAAQARVVRVEHFFLDRHPVTNRQFHQFVAAGGYEQTALWDESILPALLHFVDQTGQPGPAYWRDGCYEPGRENHPVVGISWFEAVAYTRWVGKRLPTDAEWVKAGCWPVSLSASTRVQRKYPWGDFMDHGRTNLWGTGRGDTVPVDEFAAGVSVGGVYQLIGNVWEWTRADFRPVDLGGGYMLTDVPMKSIRGGAFDTYFDNQATCQFQSGEAAMARRHNIGFRCAIGVCDLMLSRRPEVPEESVEPEEDAFVMAEEVQV